MISSLISFDSTMFFSVLTLFIFLYVCILCICTLYMLFLMLIISIINDLPYYIVCVVLCLMWGTKDVGSTLPCPGCHD